MKKLAFSAALILLTGCAAAPSRIAPAQVSAAPYQAWNCAQLVEESNRLDASYRVVAKEQLQTRHRDKVGVFWLGLPLSSMHGSNHASEVADIKGARIAVQQTIESKECDTSAPTIISSSAATSFADWESKNHSSK